MSDFICDCGAKLYLIQHLELKIMNGKLIVECPICFLIHHIGFDKQGYVKLIK
jgi:hypothetical protein